MLDGGVELLRLRMGTLLGVAAVWYLPLWLLGAVLAVAASDPAAQVTATPALVGGTGGGWTLPLAAAQAVALAALGIGVGTAVTAWRQGRDPGVRELVGAGVTRLWVAAVVVAVAGAAKLLAACAGGVGWLLVDAVTFCASVVAGAERRGPSDALRRTVALCRPAYGRCLVVVLGGLVITQVLRLSFSLGPLAVVELVDPGGVVAPLVLASSSLVLVLTEPLTACIAARAYLDLRCRVEGMDLRDRAGLGAGDPAAAAS